MKINLREEQIAMKSYSHYYTPKILANFVVSLCRMDNPPVNVIDICAGSWNLLKEAQLIWPDSKTVGIDIDIRSNGSIIEDGRVYSSILISKGELFELVLANPPFQYEVPSEKILELIKEHVPEDCFDGRVLTRLESTMMIFNSILVKPGGTLAAIVPTSLVKSESQIKLRKYLAKLFFVEKIIELPINAFGSKEISTSIVILHKTDIRENTRSYLAVIDKGEYKLTKEKSYSLKMICDGQWYEEIRSEKIINTDVSKKFIIYRNKIQTNELIKIKGLFPVIHSSTITKENLFNNSGIQFINKNAQNFHYTKAGDIVLVRVGRNCGNYIVITECESNFLTSECTLLIRPLNEIEKNRIVANLNSKNISRIKKGIAAKYITKRDLEMLFQY